MKPIAADVRGVPLQKRALRAIDLIGGRQVAEREMKAALEMLPAPSIEMRPPLFIHQPGRRIGKGAVEVAERFDADRIEEQRPARAKPTQGVVRPCTDRNQFGLRRGFEIGTSKAQGALERPILVEDHAGRDQGRPGQMIGEKVGGAAVFS
ncbi:hypothetical protein D3C73_818090 [compost metagenome]